MIVNSILFITVEELPAHIYGITHFEENIQDEWFIVALLFEITKHIPDIIVRTVDADGEFMLIEAAEHLPNWANPETCEQRVSTTLELVVVIDSCYRTMLGKIRNDFDQGRNLPPFIEPLSRV